MSAVGMTVQDVSKTLALYNLDSQWCMFVLGIGKLCMSVLGCDITDSLDAASLHEAK